MNNYWISWWHQANFTPFTLHSPWWVSGWGPQGESICAAVKAESEAAAKEKVHKAYDEMPSDIRWRFCELQAPDWSPGGDRFPMADWMQWGQSAE